LKKISLIFISFFFLCSCSTEEAKKDAVVEPTFDKVFYESVTSIKFPKDYKFITTADNGEFLTITIIDLNKNDWAKFAKDNKFEPIDDKFSQKQQLFGTNILDSTYSHVPENNKLLRNWGSNKKTNWIYLLDTTTYRLYCQIDYPDAAGT